MAVVVPVGAVLGWLANRIQVSFSHLRFPREKFVFKTAKGKEIRAGAVDIPAGIAALVVDWPSAQLHILDPAVYPRRVAGRPHSAFGYDVCPGEAVSLASAAAPAQSANCPGLPKKPPIVYLRSFRHDGKLRPGESSVLAVPLFARASFKPTAEEQLSIALNKFGPLVAIGKPGEEVPEIGAARMYVSDDDWQDVVLELLDRRGSIAVLQAGETEGLRRELSQIGQGLAPEQVLLVLPFGLWDKRKPSEEKYRTFCPGPSNACRPSFLRRSARRASSFSPRGNRAGTATCWRTRNRSRPATRSRRFCTSLLKNRTFRKAKKLSFSGVLNVFAFLILLGISSLFVEQMKPAQNEKQIADSTKALEPVVHTGAAMPYKFKLDGRFQQVATDSPGVDRAFANEDPSSIAVRIDAGQQDVDRIADRTVENMHTSGNAKFANARLVKSETAQYQGPPLEMPGSSSLN